jgi:hypothetical protein
VAGYRRFQESTFFIVAVWALERVVTTLNEYGVIPVFCDLDGELVILKEVPFSSDEGAGRGAYIYARVLGGAVAIRHVHDPSAETVG